MKTKKMFTGMLLLVFLLSFNYAIAQEKKEKYTMYTTIQIKVVKGKEKEFEKAVLSHNEKYHTGVGNSFNRGDGRETAIVFSLENWAL